MIHLTTIPSTPKFVMDTYAFWRESNSIFTIHVAYVRKYCCVETDRDFDGFAGFIPLENDNGVYYMLSVKALRYPGSLQFLSSQSRTLHFNATVERCSEISHNPSSCTNSEEASLRTVPTYLIKLKCRED
jgi:hypothetical protein